MERLRWLKMGNNYTHFSVDGLDGIFKNLERKMGREAMLEASERFAKEAGKAGKKIVREVEKGYSRTGQTIRETTYKVQRPVAGTTWVDIGWHGPKDRYKLVHLNELGYTRVGKNGISRIYPRGFGKLKEAQKIIGDSARMIARKEVQKQLKQ